jgi:hypothetical protein
MAGSNVHAPVDTYLRAISEAHTVLEHAKHQQNPAAASTAHQQLRVAVEAARDAGATWMQIGDLLDIPRGNAYRRYRRRPAPSCQGHHLDARRDSS